MTIMRDLDLDTKNEILGQGFQKLDPKPDRHTDRQTHTHR